MIEEEKRRQSAWIPVYGTDFSDGELDARIELKVFEQPNYRNPTRAPSPDERVVVVEPEYGAVKLERWIDRFLAVDSRPLPDFEERDVWRLTIEKSDYEIRVQLNGEELFRHFDPDMPRGGDYRTFALGLLPDVANTLSRLAVQRPSAWPNAERD